MKLLTKSILFYLLASLPLLVIAAVISFLSLSRTVNENLNEELWNEKYRAEAYINSFTEPQNKFLGFDSLSNIKIDSSNGVGHKYLNWFKIDAEDGEQIEYRALKSYYKSKGTNYLITIVGPKLETDDLIENLLETIIITICSLILAFLSINWILSKKLWKPFYKTIEQLNEFDLKNRNSFVSVKSGTKEFRQLNDAIEKMTSKVHSDFIAQREFTENASHETQTPLAVIKARIDLLMQSPNLKEDEMKQLQIIENSVVKLSSLNKALLLLAKIDNKQFGNEEELEFGTVLKKALNSYEETIEAKKITVEVKQGDKLKMKMNPVLADILLGNLIQNAVRHNIQGGKIIIETSENGFCISNTGTPSDFESEKMFERFTKGSTSKDSHGLGLAIVKRIAETYNMKIEHEFINGLHKFAVGF